jgi:hypothetical protein
MPLAWKFASLDGAPLVFRQSTAFIFVSGAWSEADPSWDTEAHVLSEEAFKAKFGDIELPPFPAGMTEPSK